MGKRISGEENKRRLERRNLIYFPKAILRGSDEEFGRIVDITTEGFMLVRSQKAETGIVYDLRVIWTAENNREEEFTCKARLRWCRPDVNPDLFALGFQIENEDALGDSSIRRMITKWSFPQW